MAVETASATASVESASESASEALSVAVDTGAVSTTGFAVDAAFNAATASFDKKLTMRSRDITSPAFEFIEISTAA